MNLKIKIYGEDILKEKCQEIKEIDKKIKDLAKGMLKVMRQENGVGLAAPQIGSNKRIIVVSLDENVFSLINPKITKKSKKSLSEYEGCLSLPNLFLKIKRAKEIELEGYLLEREKTVRIKAEGLLARVFQHEIDHLDGILMIDRVSHFKKIRAIKKLT